MALPLFFAGISAISSLGSVIAGIQAASNMPGAPDLTQATRAGVEADAETLPIRRQIEAAARAGRPVTYQAPEQRLRTNAVRHPVTNKWVQYNAEDWQPGGQFFNLALEQENKNRERRGKAALTAENFNPSPRVQERTINVPAQDKTVDFTGLGEADVQGKIATGMADVYAELSRKYGVAFAEEARRQLEQSDPEGTAARKNMLDLIQKQIQDKPERPVAELLDQQVASQLSAGSGMDEMSRSLLDDAVNRALSDRSQRAGMDFSEPMTTGFEGMARQQAAAQKGMGWLAGGSTPEDVEYRRTQQNLSNLGAFINQQSPVTQFHNLSGAQQGATPFKPGTAMPNVTGGDQGSAQFAQNVWGTQLNNSLQSVSPWITGLSALASGSAGMAGALGGKK
jgi:hypothetical protein